MTVPWTEIAKDSLQGPILILGASGFIGANLYRYLAALRSDVHGTFNKSTPWRLSDMDQRKLHSVDLLIPHEIGALLDQLKPATIFDCTAYGAYSFETDYELIHRTNLLSKVSLLEMLAERKIWRYIHAGSSSEYGSIANGPPEESPLAPNSHYAVTKAGMSGLVNYFGKQRQLPCANLRLYSVYGPYEDASRLIPAVVAAGIKKTYPPLVDPDISRDFLYVNDCCDAFVAAAVNLKREYFGDSFNIGTGVKTSIREVANAAREIFGIESSPEFSMKARHWDLKDWFSNSSKVETVLGWTARTPFKEGLERTSDWYRSLPDAKLYARLSKQFALDRTYSVSVVVACYKDELAIPIMHERLTQMFDRIKVDYEIIFVNDNSPDKSEAVIQELSKKDRHVRGISHSRNFGSQAAFRSGLEVASRNACVLMDGDLQDPPELIEQFVQEWRKGADVVFGRRVKREAPLHMQLLYKLFYRVFDRLSYIRIPHDAGDFSLIDKRVVESLLRFPERDVLIRGIRAFAGFRQVGVDYVRPERMFGVTTNSFWKNIGWAKKGIFAYSNVPLNFLSIMGTALFLMSLLFLLLQAILKVVFPEIAPRGITTVLIISMFFGSINLLGISILGEYIGKILEEVKRRPHFIRRRIIRDGDLLDAADGGEID